jgi:hypothetical protein
MIFLHDGHQARLKDQRKEAADGTLVRDRRRRGRRCDRPSHLATWMKLLPADGACGQKALRARSAPPATLEQIVGNR